MFDAAFFLKSILLGCGLAMDAFSVSLANGLAEPRMRPIKTVGIAGTFAFFQALMPLIGWFCVHTVLTYFDKFTLFVPWIALLLLGFIGIKMIIDGARGGDGEEKTARLGFISLLVQGVATSIDALSVGFTIADYGFLKALVAALIIALVTFILCVAGVLIGKKFGTRLSGKATILGGIILLGIGIEIFITGWF